MVQMCPYIVWLAFHLWEVEWTYTQWSVEVRRGEGGGHFCNFVVWMIGNAMKRCPKLLCSFTEKTDLACELKKKRQDIHKEKYIYQL